MSKNRRHHPQPLSKGEGRNSPQNAANNLSRRDKGIINKIVLQFTSRVRIDIKTWRDAMAEAEQDRYPKRLKWARAVKDLDLDAHWSSQIMIRNLSVLRKRFKVVSKADGKELPEKTKIFQAPWFYHLMYTWLDAKSMGTQVMEIQDLVNGNYGKSALYKIPQNHVAPEVKQIMLKDTDNSGYPYADDPYILEFCEDIKLGLLYKAAPHIIWKRNAQQSWAEFCEKFGIPMRVAITNKKDTKTLDRIEAMVDKLGSASSAVLPEGTTVDIKDANTRDAFDVFDKKIERCNSEISKLINTVTMISDSGSSLSQSQVHKEMFQKVVDSLCADFQGAYNWDIGPRLAAVGFTGLDHTKEDWVFDDTEQLSKGALWNIVQGILKFYEVDEKWLTDKFGIPLGSKRAVPIQDNNSGGNIPNNAAKMLELFNRLIDEKVLTSDQLVDILKESKESFNKARHEAAPAGLKFDAAAYNKQLGGLSLSKAMPSNAALESTFLKAAKAFFNNPSNKPATISDGEWNILYTTVAGQLWDGVQNAYNDVANPDFSDNDEFMKAALQKNMYIFSANKNFQLMLSLNDQLKDENGKLREWADFKKKALELHQDYNVNWLQAEYDTAVASAQSAAKWQQFLAERDQYNLKYQTVGDDRVRESHQALDGIVLPVDDDFWNDHYPPLAFRCRCEVIQDSSSTLSDKSKIISPDVPKMFKNNVGKTGQVFTKDHPYWKGLTTEEKNALEKLATKTIDDKKK
jgi:SPP1 gp7 family putative phage head morphogenesis protein